MKILVQNYRTGNLEMLEVPMFTTVQGLLVETMASVVSVGTEKAMIDVAKKSLLGKALARPDWVKQVIDKVKTEGLMEAWRQSKARLDMPVPLGYSCAGIVIDVGEGVEGFKKGDRVACAGSGYASHAEYNVVPPNLCVHIPRKQLNVISYKLYESKEESQITNNVSTDNYLSFEDAAYVALGGIAMEAVRLAKVEFGYRVGVIGLGLLGQLAVQILRAAGCHVIGIDISEYKCELALQNGAEVIAIAGKDDPIAIAKEFSEYEGLDAVIILASVDSDEPLIQAASMCRERGRIIAGGLVGLKIPRKLFYEKELDFAVSRAWGPGMYDPDYEERGLKYPLAYARWTAQRNMEEFLRMVSFGTVRLDTITTHRFPFEKALEAYQMILSGKEQTIGVVLQYPSKSDSLTVNSYTQKDSYKLNVKSYTIKTEEERELQTNQRITDNLSTINVGLIGAGLFARGTLLPALKKVEGISLEGVATASGLSGKHIADKFKFKYCTTDYKELLANPNVNTIFILTRHDSHAKFVCEALKAGKAVFVEKPLCINEEQLREIIDVYSSLIAHSSLLPFLMVGFNRRFAPATKQCIDFIGQNRKSSVIQIRCNAGFVPPESWVHKSDEGGGRIIGEVCHFVDLAQAITGGLPKNVFAACSESAQGLRDNLTISIQMDNGTSAGITYASQGDKSFPREEVQVFAGGSVCVIENFKNITFVASGKKKVKKSFEVDRGYVGELRATVDALKKGRPSPIDFKSIVATTLTTFAIEESITTGKSIEIDLSEWGID
jgi:predicted dehydrogenase/threonine dehydrogenase-like Zn-dependent dehydrogenase